MTAERMREDERFNGALECAMNLHAMKRRHWIAMREIAELAVIEQGAPQTTDPLAIHSIGEPAAFGGRQVTRDRTWEEWAEKDPFGEQRPKPSDRDAILAGIDAMNADEVATIRRLCDRLLLGRARYKPLDLATDTRDWKRELDEEAMDALMYASFAYLKSRAP